MPNPLRRLIFGTPFPTAKAHHAKLPNWMALPVFASDALSSVSYATEEILLVLVIAGATAGVLQVSWPIGIAIGILLAVVVTSYRQTVQAYPQGGGDYRVARENLGTIPGLTVASALLLDYVLTVAVSISAGVAAITSALPELHDHKVPLAVVFVIFIGLANLRGAKESGLLFAIPTYLFVASIFVLLGVGLTRAFAGHTLTPPLPPEGTWGGISESVGWFLILRAFSSGCTALTGVEAITDGVPAFRAPEAKNAAKVLGILGVILVTLFLGLTYLAYRIQVVPFPAEMEGHRHTVVSQIAAAIFGQTPFYYVIQVTTAMILILAANTAFVDFPRLSSYLAQDRFMPRQMANIGDRLVYSNGIVGLTLLAILTVVAFRASTHHLIPLYALGVFLSFTLGQTGMVLRWFRLRPPRWQWGALVSGVGAAATFVVLIIIAITKFTAGEPIHFFPVTTLAGTWALITLLGFVLISMWHRWMGKWLAVASPIALAVYLLITREDPLRPLEIHLGAWVVMVAIPILVWMCFRINAHYKEVAEHLTMERYDAVPDFQHTVLVLVGGLHRGIMPAIHYARSMGDDVRGVYVEIDPEKTADVLHRWQRWVPDVPLVVLESPYRSLTGPLLEYIHSVDLEREDDVVTVVIPEFVTEKWWTTLLHGQNGLLLKWALLFRENVVVTNVRYRLAQRHTGYHPLTSTLEEGDAAVRSDDATGKP